MIVTEHYLQIKELIAIRLSAGGWETVSELSSKNTAAVATKTFETFVGPKTAIAYLTPWRDGPFVLSGSYDSEGRNVLSTTTLTIEPDTSPEKVSLGVDGFMSEVDSAVSDSYAMRLSK